MKVMTLGSVYRARGLQGPQLFGGPAVWLPTTLLIFGIVGLAFWMTGPEKH